jgi:hypothetical protein
MVKTIIHIHRQRIAQNLKLPPDQHQPPIIVRQGKHRAYVNEITLAGGTRIVYSPDKPLDCGARVWIETKMGALSA